MDMMNLCSSSPHLREIHWRPRIDVELHEDENFLNYSLCRLEVLRQPRGYIEVPEQPTFLSSLPSDEQFICGLMHG